MWPLPFLSTENTHTSHEQEAQSKRPGLQKTTVLSHSLAGGMCSYTFHFRICTGGKKGLLCHTLKKEMGTGRAREGWLMNQWQMWLDLPWPASTVFHCYSVLEHRNDLWLAQPLRDSWRAWSSLLHTQSQLSSVSTQSVLLSLQHSEEAEERQPPQHSQHVRQHRQDLLSGTKLSVQCSIYWNDCTTIL